MKSKGERHRPGRNVMRTAERREEILQSSLVRYIDDRKSGAHFVLVSPENIVVTNGHIEKAAGGDSRRIVVVIFGPRSGNTQQGRPVLRPATQTGWADRSSGRSMDASAIKPCLKLLVGR